MPDQSSNDAKLLAEVTALLRDLPSLADVQQNTLGSIQWRGSAQAVLASWDRLRAVHFGAHIMNADSQLVGHGEFAAAVAIIYEALHALKMRGNASETVAVAKGNVFEWFNAVRNVLEQAQGDVLMVDPWMDADFAERYLPHVAPQAQIRLLTTGNKLAKLMPAVKSFVGQHGHIVEVRENPDLHGRYIFVDAKTGYQSDASFKDGAKNADAVIMEIPSGAVLAAVQGIFEQRWAHGTPRS